MSIIAGCQNPGNNVISEKGKDIPVTAPLSLSVEELIADYDTIRLEASAHSLLSGILQIHIMNNKLYVTDNSMSIIFIYSMQGKYLSKICNQGEGPEEYIKIGSFETDVANNRLLLTDSFSKRLFEYDENGNLLQTIPLSFSPTLIASDKSKRYIHLNSASKNEYGNAGMEKNNIHIIDSKGNATETFLKDDTPQRIDIMSACAASYTEDKELLYMPILSNIIYRIHNSQAIPEYTLNNQSNRKTITDEEKKELFYEYGNNNIEEAEENGYLISCGSFLHSDSLVFLDLGWNLPLYTYYSKSNDVSITINPDRLKGNKGLCEIFSAHPKAISNNSLYISVPLEKIQYTLPLLPQGKLKTFFEGISEEDNPCIIAYRLKDELFTNKN